jgi:hypothetical protein
MPEQMLSNIQQRTCRRRSLASGSRHWRPVCHGSRHSEQKLRKHWLHSARWSSSSTTAASHRGQYTRSTMQSSVRSSVSRSHLTCQTIQLTGMSMFIIIIYINIRTEGNSKLESSRKTATLGIDITFHKFFSCRIIVRLPLLLIR